MSKILEQVTVDLSRQESKGLSKYGTTLDTANLSLLDALQHAYEETLDHAMYLKTAINLLKDERKGNGIATADERS